MDCHRAECVAGRHTDGVDAPPEPLTPARRPDRAEATTAGSVLLVDDDPRTFGVLSGVFERAGIRLVSARSGDEAIRVAESARPDLVLLDIVMPPGIDGFETLGRMRYLASLKSIPVIFLSSVRQSFERIHGLELGAVDFVSKPVKSEEVLARVKTHLMIRRLQSDLAERNAELQAVNHRMSRDLEAAARIQRALLPIELPIETGYEFGWAYRSCTELGGDGLGIFRLRPDTVGFYLLDVSGHGVAASLLAVSVARALDPRLDRAGLVIESGGASDSRRVVPPAEVLRRLNTMYPLELDRNPHFITMIYGLLDGPSGVVRFAAAGHPSPILRGVSGTTECVTGGAVPLGVRPETAFAEVELRLRPGERLFIHSDGLNEQIGPDNQDFGIWRLRSAVAAGEGSIQQTVEGVMERVLTWADPRPVRDDLSLLGIGRLRSDEPVDREQGGPHPA